MMNKTGYSFQPIIIVGAARSGTNMLRDILADLPGVGTWPCDEINYIWRHFNTDHPNDEFPLELATSRVQQYLRHEFARQAQRGRVAVLLEKTCANSLRIEFVRHVFPEAKFIFIVRDGCDVVASALQRWKAKPDFRYLARKSRFVPPSDLAFYASRYAANQLYRLTSRNRRLRFWGPHFAGMQQLLEQSSLVEVCVEQWRRSVLKAARALDSCAPTSVCRLRYETLARSPKSELDRVCRFVCPSITVQKIDDLASRVRDTSIGKWRVTEQAAQIAAFKPTIDAVLAKLESGIVYKPTRAA